MRITLITVGKIKEKYFRSAVEEYSKRLGRYCKLNIIEVADEKTPEACSDVEKDIIRKKEADRILKNVPHGAYVITLEINGKQQDSEKFAKQMQTLGVNGRSHIVFIIGGSIGLHKKISDISDCKMSFGRITLPHQLMRVVLLEQIYRAYKIINKEPYHK